MVPIWLERLGRMKNIYQRRVDAQLNKNLIRVMENMNFVSCTLMVFIGIIDRLDFSFELS